MNLRLLMDVRVFYGLEVGNNSSPGSNGPWGTRSKSSIRPRAARSWRPSTVPEGGHLFGQGEGGELLHRHAFAAGQFTGGAVEGFGDFQVQGAHGRGAVQGGGPPSVASALKGVKIACRTAERYARWRS